MTGKPIQTDDYAYLFDGLEAAIEKESSEDTLAIWASQLFGLYEKALQKSGRTIIHEPHETYH